MRFSEDRRKVTAALASWLDANSTDPVIRVLEGERPEISPPAFFKEVPRLIVVLEGRGTFLTIEQKRENVFDVVPGQVVFLGPCTWICPIPRTAYRSLSIAFQSDSTRLTIYSRRPMAADGTIAGHYSAQWRTQDTLGAKGEHLLKLLQEPPAERLGDRTFTLVMEILRAEISALTDRAPEHFRPSQSVLWQSVNDYLSAHWSDPQLSREMVARFFKRHPNHFSRFFHKHAKTNFRAYVNNIRLERSMQFLRDLRYNVTDAANLCGFTDAQYFTRCFRQRFGFTPGAYRKGNE